MGTEPLIYAAIFIGVFLIIQGIYMVLFGKSARLESKVNRRLELLESGEDPEEVLETLRSEREQHRSGFRVPLLAPLSEKAAKANIQFTPRGLVMVMLVVGIAVFVGLTVGTSAGIVIRIGTSFVMAYGGLYMWLNSKAKARFAKFEEQLPDAVELIVRSLKVGHPFSSSIAIVAKEMDDPLGSEFGMIADESQYGMDISESLTSMAERIDMQDLRFLAVAVSIQAQSGGNLAEVLEGLASVIRSRFKLFRRVKAITAEARWSGMFLSAFPLAAIIFMQLAKPDFYDDVKETPFFIPAAIVVGVLLTVNVIFMRIMVNIKV